MHESSTLIYVHDPMCSWCWGFRPALAQLRSLLPPEVAFARLLGGLAPDSEQPMPEAMQSKLQDTWRRIQQRIPGSEFNFDFWRDCRPRRSTYPACRAVIAARQLDAQCEDAMILAIQQAYYLRAMNPSDADTLVQLASELGLDRDAFARLLRNEQVEQQLQDEIARARAIGAHSFPSLVLQTGPASYWPVGVQYTDPQGMLDTVKTLIA